MRSPVGKSNNNPRFRCSGLVGAPVRIHHVENVENFSLILCSSIMRTCDKDKYNIEVKKAYLQNKMQLKKLISRGARTHDLTHPLPTLYHRATVAVGGKSIS